MKLDIQEKLNELIAFAEVKGLSEVSWADGELHISFRRGPALSPVANGNATEEVVVEPVNAEPVFEHIKSPMVGTFQRSAAKGRPPMVLDGDHVKPGDRVGVIQSMGIATEVISVVGGVIKKILVEDGQPVEYGQPLISVEPGV
jgi:acetyl-CoA carboxylase biotin carboxyl carrier protein